MHALTSRRRFLQSTGTLLAGAPRLVPALEPKAAKPTIEIGVHPYSLKPLFASGAWTLESYPRLARETLNLDIIEFDVADCAALFEKPERAQRYRQIAADHGVRIGTLLAGATPALDATAKAIQERALAEHRRWTEVAHQLGCAFLRVRAGTSGEDKSTAQGAAITGLGQLADAMRDSGVRPLLENIQGFSRDPKWVTGIVDAVGADRLGALGDFGNFDGDIYQGMDALTPYCDALCSKSWNFDARGEETEIAFGRIMKIVKAHAFSGWIAIEYLGTETPPVEGILKTAALIRKWANV